MNIKHTVIMKTIRSGHMQTTEVHDVGDSYKTKVTINVQLNNHIQQVCYHKHLKLGMWNINGFPEWKRASHIDMINMINYNGITLIVET